MESLWWNQIFCLIFVYLTQPEYFRCGEVGYTIENMDHQIGFGMFLCFIFFVNDWCLKIQPTVGSITLFEIVLGVMKW